MCSLLGSQTTSYIILTNVKRIILAFVFFASFLKITWSVNVLTNFSCRECYRRTPTTLPFYCDTREVTLQCPCGFIFIYFLFCFFLCLFKKSPTLLTVSVYCWRCRFHPAKRGCLLYVWMWILVCWLFLTSSTGWLRLKFDCRMYICMLWSKYAHMNKYHLCIREYSFTQNTRLEIFLISHILLKM